MSRSVKIEMKLIRSAGLNGSYTTYSPLTVETARKALPGVAPYRKGLSTMLRTYNDLKHILDTDKRERSVGVKYQIVVQHLRTGLLCRANYEPQLDGPSRYPIIKRLYEQLCDDIQAQRAAARQPRRHVLDTRYVNPESSSQVAYTLVGRAHTKPGEMLAFAKMRKYGKVLGAKRPLDSDKHVGIEIEFYADADRATLQNALGDANLGDFVTLKTDGSVHPPSGSDKNPFEICVMAKQDMYPSIVAQVCEVLRQHGAEVNKTCGLHVHIDARNRDAKVMYKNLVYSQSILFAMQPASRRENQYCKRNRGAKLRRYGAERYRAINDQSLHRHRTIEVRLHSGTVDPNKINAWVKLLLAIVDAPEYAGPVKTVTGLVRKTGIDTALAAYIKTRMRKFNSDLAEDSDPVRQAPDGATMPLPVLGNNAEWVESAAS